MARQRFWVPDALWATKVSLPAKATYALLCRLKKGGRDWDMTHQQLAVELGCGERMVRLVLTELRTAGMAAWKRSTKGVGRARPNVYEPLPLECWKEEAFRAEHPACGAGSDEEAEGRDPAKQDATPGTEERDTRHVVPTPGSTAPGSTTPGRETHTPGAPAPARVCAPPASGFDAVDDFEDCWTLYPRKVGKAVALRAWIRLDPDDTLVARIRAAIGKQSESDQWIRGVVPNFANWLRREGWEDHLDPWIYSPEEVGGS